MSLGRLRKIPQMIKQNRLLSIAIVGSLIVAVAWDNASSSARPTERQIENLELDTFIPAGKALVPIEIQNVESLDSMLGQFGIVSLYTSDPNRTKDARLIAARVKLIRAPNNPQQFGVLVAESQVKLIAGEFGPFFVVLHSRDVKEGGAVEPKSTKSTALIIEE